MQIEYKNIYMGEYRDNSSLHIPDHWHIFFSIDLPYEIKVTHWMPLPQPPKDK